MRQNQGEGSDQPFPIEIREPVISVGSGLQQAGLIRDAQSFRDDLVYSGLDTTVQAGSDQLSPAISRIDLTHELQDATSEEVAFVILPARAWKDLSLGESAILKTD